MRGNLSNKKVDRVQFKLDVWNETRELLRKASDETGYPMAMIVNILVKYYLKPLHIEDDVRRHLAEFARKNREELKLSKRQKKVIEDASKYEFTDDLI